MYTGINMRTFFQLLIQKKLTCPTKRHVPSVHRNGSVVRLNFSMSRCNCDPPDNFLINHCTDVLYLHVVLMCIFTCRNHVIGENIFVFELLADDRLRLQLHEDLHTIFNLPSSLNNNKQ